MTKAAPLKRPYQVLYYEGNFQSPASQGHAGSEHGAIRASVVRVFLKQYTMARIFEGGVLIYTVWKRGRELVISYGDVVHKR